MHCLGRDRAFRRFWVFDSVPGIFVEHDDDLVGECRDEPTPWDPELIVEPLNEEQAVAKAREIMKVIQRLLKLLNLVVEASGLVGVKISL